MMANYYRMLFLEDPKLGVAWTDSPTDLVLPYLGQVESWIPPVLHLRDGEGAVAVIRAFMRRKRPMLFGHSVNSPLSAVWTFATVA
jgi:hypothetical protein